jgi:peptidoglycan/xylan/chitin deacetylase (PgdA/CDA1 family)
MRICVSHLQRMALACLLSALIGVGHAAQPAAGDRLLIDKFGAIYRGDVDAKTLSLVFTGDEHGESFEPILDALKVRKIQGGFFVSGNFLRQPRLRKIVERAIAEGHYVGPHSDKHLLYASWDDRKSLVTQAEFTADLNRNISDLKALGALPGKRTSK